MKFDLTFPIEAEEAIVSRNDTGGLVATIKKEVEKEEVLMALARIHDLTCDGKLKTVEAGVEMIVDNGEVHGYVKRGGKILVVGYHGGYIFNGVSGTAKPGDVYTLVRVDRFDHDEE